MFAQQKERRSSILDIYNKNKFLFNPGSKKTDNRGQGVTFLDSCNAQCSEKDVAALAS